MAGGSGTGEPGLHELAGAWTMVSVGPFSMSFRPEKTHAEFA